MQQQLSGGHPGMQQQKKSVPEENSKTQQSGSLSQKLLEIDLHLKEADNQLEAYRQHQLPQSLSFKIQSPLNMHLPNGGAANFPSDQSLGQLQAQEGAEHLDPSKKISSTILPEPE